MISSLFILFILLLLRGDDYNYKLYMLLSLRFSLLALANGNSYICNSNKTGALKYQNSKSHILQICTRIQWQYICAKPNSTFWNENEARVACYKMKMSWEEESGNTN